jgi:hypothetical protein
VPFWGALGVEAHHANLTRCELRNNEVGADIPFVREDQDIGA